MDKKQGEVRLFEQKQVRSAWDESTEEWLFSVVDVIGVLTDQPNRGGARNYWKVLKKRLSEEGNQSVINCNQLKLVADDGKKYSTDVMTTKQLLRLIQSIPSKKAEPFKVWLAEVGNDRINEVQDPELTIERAMKEYRNLGYTEEWITARLQSIQFRKELTDQWKRAGVEEGLEYAILTNIISQGWSGMTVQEYKNLKGLKKESLRDNMSSVELALNILAEATTAELSKERNPQGLEQSSEIAEEGGAVALSARKDIEKRTGKSAITAKTAADLRRIEEKGQVE